VNSWDSLRRKTAMLLTVAMLNVAYFSFPVLEFGLEWPFPAKVGLETFFN
jgi:hypothetical protein